jgi:lysophospholipase L1-like esterase
MAGRIALVLVSALSSLLVLELGCRLVLEGPGGLVHWPNLVLAERVSTRGSFGQLVPDARLGFAGRPNYAGDRKTQDANGWRVSPSPEGVTLAEPPVLVMGDSLAYGHEVGDNDTWPAKLQLLLRRRVINAAVSAYGFDQIELAAELAAVKVKPAAILLSFSADDMRRNEMKRVWGAEKPYFTLAGDKLELHNVPVPPSPRPADTLDIWQWAFGWSLLLDTVLRHQGWQYEWAVDHERVQPRRAGVPIACALLDRLKQMGTPIVVVAEYNRYVFENAEYGAETHAMTKELLDCADRLGLPTLDLFDVDRAAVRARGIDAVFLKSHTGPVGTEIAADAIAAELGRRGLPHE